MKVSEAVKTRISCRSFLEKPVPETHLRKIIEIASLSPSGGNLQPWNLYVLTGKPLDDLKKKVKSRLLIQPKGLEPQYNIYPPNLKQKYAERRFKCGEDLYRKLKIKRNDRQARRNQFAKNFEFFGAPVGLFLYTDKSMGPPQWSDLGIFIQTIMLQSREMGLHTCAQEAWAIWYKLLQDYLKPPVEQMLFCGIALGYLDEKAAINQLRTEREKVENFTVFLGF